MRIRTVGVSFRGCPFLLRVKKVKFKRFQSFGGRNDLIRIIYLRLRQFCDLFTRTTNLRRLQLSRSKSKLI